MIADTIDNDRTNPGSEGTLLANRYRIIRQLGQGGMGSVWLAEDIQLDNKQFAIKMLPSILVSNKRAYAQLKSEALVAMKLTHPNIVTLRAFEENNGNPFLVMDYVDGRTLDDYLADVATASSPSRNGGDAVATSGLSEQETIRILKPIAAALDYAHKEGVVHRDVKPANVMIRNDGRPFILDFGISREMQETMTRVTGKLSGGTLLYMSPEQLRGFSPKPAQDVYSFAAMAYECMSGHPPFYRGAIEDQIKNEQPESLGVTSFCASIMSGLAKKPEARPATCAGVLSGGVLTQRIRGAAGAEEVSRVPHDRTGVTPLPRPQNSHALAKSLGILALITGAFGLGALLMVNRTGFKSEKRSEAQYKGVRHVPSKPIVTEETAPVDGEHRWFTLPGGVEMEMVYVAPGSFRMGSEFGEDDEKPVHDVRITKGYWIGKYPVTQAQWNALVTANGVSFNNGGKPVPHFSSSGVWRDRVAGLDTSDFPMENISWEDCDTLVKALNKNEKGGRTWAMPTEAQWEFAARGGNKSRGYKYSGGDNMDDVGWYYENSGTKRLFDSEWKVEALETNKCRTHSVREKGVGNELGIVGMSGNVWEWSQDLYDENYYSKCPTDDPCNTASGGDRVLRGGSWHSIARYCRFAYRCGSQPGYRHGSRGFRLCCSAGPRE